MAGIDPTLLQLAGETLPDLPPADIQIRVGGIVGTLTWGAVAYWYKEHVGRALTNLTRDDDF